MKIHNTVIAIPSNNTTKQNFTQYIYIFFFSKWTQPAASINGSSPRTFLLVCFSYFLPITLNLLQMVLDTLSLRGRKWAGVSPKCSTFEHFSRQKYLHNLVISSERVFFLKFPLIDYNPVMSGGFLQDLLLLCNGN